MAGWQVVQVQVTGAAVAVNRALNGHLQLDRTMHVRACSDYGPVHHHHHNCMCENVTGTRASFHL